MPLVWDMDPSELPAWSAQVQAVNLRGATAEGIQQLMRRIAGRIRAEEADRIDRAVLIGLAALGAFAFLSQGKQDTRK